MTYLLHGHTSFTGMGWMDAVPGTNGQLFIGGLYALYQANLIEQNNITHVLSVIDYDAGLEERFPGRLKVLWIKAEDAPRENLLVWFERAVGFVEGALEEGGARGEVVARGSESGGGEAEKTCCASGFHGREQEQEQEEKTQTQTQQQQDAQNQSQSPPSTPAPARLPSIFIHCAMGKSRSATLVLAYLVWKTPRLSVSSALSQLCQGRPVCDPNPGFMEQLDVWRDMCNAESAEEKRSIYEEWEKNRFTGEYWEWGDRGPRGGEKL